MAHQVNALTREIATLMRAEMHGQGETLRETLPACRARLPRRLRRAADHLAEIEPIAAHPKLCHRLDPLRAAQAHRELKAHLKRIGQRRRRGDLVLAILGSIAFGLLCLLGVLLAVLRWRGFL